MFLLTKLVDVKKHLYPFSVLKPATECGNIGQATNDIVVEIKMVK